MNNNSSKNTANTHNSFPSDVCREEAASVTIVKKITLILISSTPLLMLRFIGGFFGAVSFWARRRSRLRSVEFAKSAGVKNPLWIAFLSYIDFGKAIFEGVWIWLNPPINTIKKTKNLTDKKIMDELIAHQNQKKPILFIGCHLGASEAAIIYVNSIFNNGALYQRQKNTWLLAMRALAHPTHKVEFFSMDVSGIRNVKIKLNEGGAVGISADQTPFEGSGQWLDFFGKPANTMMLAPKLAQTANIRVVFVLHIRIFNGFSVQLIPLEDLPKAPSEVALKFNQTFEKHILKYPSQYRWAYDRYRVRRK